jgi:hypothetical protein
VSSNPDAEAAILDKESKPIDARFDWEGSDDIEEERVYVGTGSSGV